MSKVEAPEELQDPTAAQTAELEIPPALVAQTLGQYSRAWLARIRGGQSGVLPVIAGLLLITIIFEAISPRHVYLSADNLVNLFQQSAVFMVLAMAEAFVLLLGEIDLSVGYVAAIGGVIGGPPVQPAPPNPPRWAPIGAPLPPLPGRRGPRSPAPSP